MDLESESSPWQNQAEPPALSALSYSQRVLRESIAALREEHLATRDLLAQAGLITEQQVLAQVHRRRFAKARTSRPCAFEATLSQVLAASPGALIGEMLGADALGPMAVMSPELGRYVAEVKRTVEKPRWHQFFVFGGCRGREKLSDAERFNLGTRRWKAQEGLRQPRQGAAAVVHHNTLFVCGGSDGQSMFNTVERFDPLSGTWEDMPPMAESRSGAVAVATGGRLYVCGGHDWRTIMNSAECLLLDRWEAIDEMRVRRWGPAAAVVQGRIHVCGGNNGRGDQASHELFDTSTKVWMPLPEMSERRWNAVGACLGGRFYVCGGSEKRHVKDSLECYDPVSGVWETLPPMLSARRAAVGGVYDGHLWVCGGSNGPEDLKTMECFDPQVGAWHEGPSMRLPRSNGMMALLLA